ncbi:MAG: HNH endonuclease [Bacteroidia bacterium]|nr:HNH endonuclease [Bacteroidia bacterium]MCZ2276811.1 HNH endonuclease [Bacteroidia bacterium]
MIKPLPKEQWKEILFNIKGKRNRYAISNLGRVAVFKTQFEDGQLLKGTMNNGYASLKIKPGGRDIQLMIHRIVADAFLPRRKANQEIVIHKNFKKTDNDVSNLKWVTKEEAYKHAEKNPVIIRLRKQRMAEGHKLNIAKVREIKRLIRNPGKLTMKQIARKFRISEMQLYRIKRGENWGHVK